MKQQSQQLFNMWYILKSFIKIQVIRSLIAWILKICQVKKWQIFVPGFANFEPWRGNCLWRAVPSAILKYHVPNFFYTIIDILIIKFPIFLIFFDISKSLWDSDQKIHGSKHYQSFIDKKHSDLLFLIMYS